MFEMNEERGGALARELGGLFCQVDVTSDDSVANGFAQARAVHGQERVLVCCAGTSNAYKTVSVDRASGRPKHFPIDAFDRIVKINLVGTFRCVARSAAGMLTLDALDDGERGAVVNTSSVAAEDGQIGQAAYAASKAAVVGMTLAVARDMMGDGIRVNTIMPGLFDTPMMQAAPEPLRAALAAAVPFPRRLGLPDEFAALAEQMLTNRYLNGESVRLDGAIRMPPR
jgi:NAD(P)-dependent dehydrogenase (short-subunit alcohol dehydrogenase family)